MADSEPRTIPQRIKNIINPQTDYHKTPRGLRWRSSTLFIISTVGIGLFTDLFLYGLVVPILPFLLQDAVGLPKDQIQSHVSGLLAAYAGASFLFSPFAGYIADKTASRQAPYLGGLSCLIIATVLFFLGQSVAVLLVARILQGASAAFVWTVGLALCIDTVGPANLGKTIGTIFSFITIGELFAPIIGGALYRKSGANGVMILALGILLIDLFMRILVIEKKVAARYTAHEQRSGDEDDENGDAEADADEETALLTNGHKKDSDEYLIPPDQPTVIRNVPILYCFRNSSLITAQVVALVQALILAGFDATLPTHAQEVYGFDSLKAGLLFVPLSVVNAIVGPIGGWAIDKYGTKPVAVFGYAYIVPILVLLRLPGSEPGQVYVLGALMALSGIGLAVIGSPSIVEAGAVVDRYHKRNPDFFGEQGPYAQLYAINSMVFCFGLSVGPILTGGLKDSIGYGNMNAILAVIAGITAVICFVWLGGKPRCWKR